MIITPTCRAIRNLRRAVEDLNDCYEDDRDLYALVSEIPPSLGQYARAVQEIETIIARLEVMA